MDRIIRNIPTIALSIVFLNHTYFFIFPTVNDQQMKEHSGFNMGVAGLGLFGIWLGR